MFVSNRLPFPTSSKMTNNITTTLHCMSRKKITYGQIGDHDYFLMQLSNQEFMKEIWQTRAQFRQRFPELVNYIYEYKKQRTLLDIEFWYEKPVPKRCERFLEMEVYSLLENVEKDSEDERITLQICHNILCEYLPYKYKNII